MRCPFCSHKQERSFSCSRCGAGSGALTEGQMTVLRERLKDANKESKILGILGSIMLGLGWWSISWGYSLPWVIVSFSFMVLSYLLGILHVLEARDLEWILIWWGRQKK